VSEYCRQDVLRILSIRDQQLRIWERNGLIACSNNYSFQELGQVRRLRELGACRISAGSIREAISAMRAASGCPEPLLEAGVAFEASGSGARRLIFRHSGIVMEPIAGQYLLDFTGTGKQAIAAITAASASACEQQAARLFSVAVHAEEAGKIEEATQHYEAVLQMAPHHAASAINLGTIFYNRREYARAEQLYRMATESDGSYALAFFDLGNVLDELKRMPDAITAYRRAIELQPAYADAHYNLALALERNGQRRSALSHWTTYLRLDGSGPWAVHARMQLRKTLHATGLAVLPGSSTFRASAQKSTTLATQLRVV
jgi:tetratricopeptide (TPR) repeat protein